MFLQYPFLSTDALDALNVQPYASGMYLTRSMQEQRHGSHKSKSWNKIAGVCIVECTGRDGHT